MKRRSKQNPRRQPSLGVKMTTEQIEAAPMTERDLCLDASNMVNKIFEADSEWLKRMCEEEVKQREANEV
jgi:hypothetical protein